MGGSAGLVYTPDTIQAAVGDFIKFNFMDKNHTVTQSTFPKPCVKMAGGHDSGFLPNPGNAMSPPPSFLFQVKDPKPTCKFITISYRILRDRCLTLCRVLLSTETALRKGHDI